MALLPDQLMESWDEVTTGRRTEKDFAREQQRWLDDYRSRWFHALLRDSEADLRTGLHREIAAYYDISDLAEVERRCRNAVLDLKREWRENVNSGQRSSIDYFYESPTIVYELMEWHSLTDDTGPLAYVLALDIANAHRVRSCLDFGSGVGSGAILFIHAGFDVSLADISATLLNFALWRIGWRGLQAHFIDLKHTALPTGEFDMILAMDVFEHLSDPKETVDHLWQALKPGGLLFARIHAESDPDRPQHIVTDFGPTFERIRELGLVEQWVDKWLWGHRLFQKT
jgi:2-polyprenyl-3-methyl-5-hydroxy-6-metoxy-1,4-benzoquinol methylase